MHELHSADYAVFFFYFIIVSGYGFYIYHRKKKLQMDSREFFLAEGSLTWWAIGASLIASKLCSSMRARTAEWHQTYTLPGLWDFYQPSRQAHGCPGG